MSTIRDNFLSDLATDDDERAALVETLRASAARLVDTAALNSVGSAYGAEVSATEAGVYHLLAGRLRDVAQRLCDHTRIGVGDRCRYCEALMVERV